MSVRYRTRIAAPLGRAARGLVAILLVAILPR